MSRSHRRARWATCALVLLSVATAATAVAQPRKSAPRKKRVSITQCTRFDQKDREDDGVDLVIDNQCEVKLACSVHWKVMCNPGTRKATSSDHGAAFTLDTLTQQATTASPVECGSDSWAIDDVAWTCNPQP